MRISTKMLKLVFLVIVFARLPLSLVLSAKHQEIEMQSAVGPLEQENHQLQCLPGFLYNTTLSKCECYPNSNVRCVESEAFLKFGYCMTYQEGEGTFLGFCISFLAYGRNVTDRVYISLPDNITKLNEYMCGPMNRRGIACSECIDGFAPSMTSLGFQCSNCTAGLYGVPMFLFLEIVPLTIYFMPLSFHWESESPQLLCLALCYTVS